MRNRILVVEDDLELAELLTFNLTKAGFQVGVATDGAKALQLVRTHTPSLILLDLMLPELDGLVVCEILRRNSATREIPIIILTAMPGQLARMASLGAGANDYMTKPFRMRDLLERIDLMLHNCSEHVPPAVTSGT